MQLLEQAYTSKIVMLESVIAKMKQDRDERDPRNLQGRLTAANLSKQNMTQLIAEKDALLNKALNDIQSLEAQHDDLAFQYADLKKEYQDLLKRQVQLKISAAKEKEEAASQLSKAHDEIQVLQGRCEELSKSQKQLIVNANNADKVFHRQKLEMDSLKDELANKEDDNQKLRLENERLMLLLAERQMPELVDFPDDCRQAPQVKKSCQLDARKESALRGSCEDSDSRVVQEA
ncbi:MAG: hypothetical protein LLG04_07330 [Parachlamydia sp.]|nr:hypothetical protein [Parachlamydia sp.]